MPPINLNPIRTVLEHIRAALDLATTRLGAALTVVVSGTPTVTLSGTPNVTVANATLSTSLASSSVPFFQTTQNEVNFGAGYIQRLQ